MGACATDLIFPRYIGPKPIYRRYIVDIIDFFTNFSLKRLSITDIMSNIIDIRYIGDISANILDIFIPTSQQNGRAERKLHHILDVVRATTIVASTPCQFWGEAALTAVYTINRCPSPIVHNQTPYDSLFGSSPSHDLVRVFGCVYFVLL